MGYRMVVVKSQRKERRGNYYLMGIDVHCILWLIPSILISENLS
jgi:hypothetical protein